MTSVKLQSPCIGNVPFQNYEKKFTFVVNGEEFQTSKIVSDLISPYICKIHSKDPNFNRFIINTKHRGDFSQILKHINLDVNNYPESELPFIHEVIEILNNEYIKSEEITFKDENHPHVKLTIFFLMFYFLSNYLFLIIYIYQFIKITPKEGNLYYNIFIFPTKCHMFNYILDLKTNSCENQCIKNLPAGRFGNNLIEILRGVQFARSTGIKEIYVPYGFFNQIKSFNYINITFKMAKLRRYKYFHNECHHVKLFYPFERLPRIPFKVDPEFVDWIYSQYPKVEIPDDALVAYIRSGDVFGKGHFIHPWYGQPPCQYFLDAFKKGNFSKLIIVAEDDVNPCVNILKNHSGIHNVNNFEKDISILLHAKNLVISRGSFGYAIALLSRKLTNFYTFNLSSSRLIDHWNCIPSEKYLSTVVNNWTDSQFQREMIVNSSCSRWEFVPHGNQNLEAYIHEQSI